MSELPEGWTNTRLDEIGNLRMGKTILAKELVSDGLPVYSAGTENKPWGYVADNETAFPRGTIVVSARGTIGAVKVPDHDSFISTQTTIAVSPEGGVDPEFLARQLSLFEFASVTSTTAIPMLTISKFGPTEIKIPPLPEQRRIVAKLDRLSARTKAARAHLARVQALAARAKQATLAAAFFSLELDSTVHALADVVSIKSGGTPKGISDRLDPGGSVHWFKVSSMNEPGNEAALTASSFRLSPSDAKALGLRLFPKGTVVFPKRGGAIATNKKRVLAFDAAVDLNLMTLVAGEHLSSEFLRLWVEGVDLSRISNGSNVPQINFGDVAHLRIPVPSLAEQESTVRRIEAAFARIDRMVEDATRTAHLLDRLDQRLLAKAFRGELVPQDPTDEPASELLARIEATRAAAPKPKRGRRQRA